MKRELFDISRKHKFPNYTFGNKSHRKTMMETKKKERRFVRRKINQLVNKLTAFLFGKKKDEQGSKSDRETSIWI